MFTELLFQIVLSMAESNGWNVPSSGITFHNPDSFVDWMIENNPERKEEIEEKFEQLRTILNERENNEE